MSSTRRTSTCESPRARANRIGLNHTFTVPELPSTWTWVARVRRQSGVEAQAAFREDRWAQRSHLFSVYHGITLQVWERRGVGPAVRSQHPAHTLLGDA